MPMNRFGGLSADLRPPGPRGRHLRRATLAALACPAVAAAQIDPAGLPASPPWLLAFALLAAALVIAAAVAFRAIRTKSRLAAQLREARTRSTCLEPLLDVWLWHSDAQHRVVSVRPPHGAPAGDWSAAPAALSLWERFTPGDASALQAMLAHAAALDDLEVQLAGPTPPRCGLLRGRACSDAAGLFAGYHGTFHEFATVPVAANTTVPIAAIPTAAAIAALPVGPAPATDHESFSFTVSHDLRAPIRVVEGFTKIVKEDYGRLLDRVGNDHLDRVLGAAARMNNMIDALLALSKLSSQPLAQQPVNLSQLASYVADDLRRQSPQRAVQIEIEPGMQVQGDPTLLRVVVENLLGNAWKYTGKAAQANIGFVRHAQQADSFTVWDNGAGFDMRFADRLFGVFQRLHSANDFPGTGVGLASVRRIVRRHGGDIWGEAEVNRGARFHFTLPQGAAPAP